MRYISRSSILSFFRCRRKGYWSFILGGTGLDSPRFSYDLVVGIAVHRGLERLLLGDETETAVERGLSEFDSLTSGKKPDVYYASDAAEKWAWEEERALTEALLRGWIQCRWPEFAQQYEIISVEESATSLLTPTIALQSRWDFIVKERASGFNFLGNWKTTASYKDWPQKWGMDVQMWTETLAAEAKLGIEISGVLVVGLLKGTRNYGEVRSNYLIHPYRKRNEADGSFTYSDTYEQRKGWERTDMWKPPNPGIRDWIERGVSQEILQKHFMTTHPIFRNQDVMEKWLRQVRRQEEDNEYVLREASLEAQLDYFSQNISYFNCMKCIFREPCFGATTVEEMLQTGKLIPRAPNHPAPMEDEQ